MNSKLSYFFYSIFIIVACNPTDTTSPASTPFQFTTGSSRTYLEYKRSGSIDSTIRTITIVGQDTSRWYFEIKDSSYYNRSIPKVTISCDTCIEKNDSLICKNYDLSMYFCPKVLYDSLITPLVVGEKTYYYYYANKNAGTMDYDEAYYFRDIGLVKYYRAHHSPNMWLYGYNLIKVNGEDNNLYLYLPD